MSLPSVLLPQLAPVASSTSVQPSQVTSSILPAVSEPSLAIKSSSIVLPLPPLIHPTISPSIPVISSPVVPPISSSPSAASVAPTEEHHQILLQIVNAISYSTVVLHGPIKLGQVGHIHVTYESHLRIDIIHAKINCELTLKI